MSPCILFKDQGIGPTKTMISKDEKRILTEIGDLKLKILGEKTQEICDFIDSYKQPSDEVLEKFSKNMRKLLRSLKNKEGQL